MTLKTLKLLIVPSNGVTSLNQLSNTRTLLRCEEALKLWNIGEFDYIVASGGLGHNKKIQTTPVADIMKKWLVSNGVPETQVISENKSLDTYTNIHYSLKLLKTHCITLDNIAFVSHWTHLTRIKLFYGEIIKLNLFVFLLNTICLSRNGYMNFYGFSTIF